MSTDTSDELHYVCSRNILQFDPSVKPPTKPQTSFVHRNALTRAWLSVTVYIYRKQRLNICLLKIFSILRKGGNALNSEWKMKSILLLRSTMTLNLLIITFSNNLMNNFQIALR